MEATEETARRPPEETQRANLPPDEAPADDGRAAKASARRRRVAFLWIAVLALELGIFMRAYLPISMFGNFLVTCDGRVYWIMAQNIAAGKGLVLEAEICNLDVGPTHHFSPLWPIVEAGFIRVLGDSVETATTAMIFVSIAMLAIVFFTTRDLFGFDAALAVTAAQSLEPLSMYYGSRNNYAENLFVALLVLTVWAILKSLRGSPNWMIGAGLFAGLAYLTKAETGWFFLVAVAGGAAWRLWHRGRKGIINTPYLIGGALFAGLVLGWAARNLYYFWDGSAEGLLRDWHTSAGLARVTARAAADPYMWLRSAAPILPMLVLLYAIGLGPLRPYLAKLRAKVRDEQVSLLLISTGILFAISWLLAGALRLHEGTSPFWAQTQRFVAPGLMLMWWAVVGYAGPVSNARWAALYAFLAWYMFAWPELTKSVFGYHVYLP